MAIAFNAGTASSFGTIATITFAHTVSGANRILIVLTACRDESKTVTGITYNGVALTFIRSGLSSPVAIEMWRLVAPAAGGAHDVVVTFTGAPTTWNAAIAVSFTGVDQTTPIDVTPIAEHTVTSVTGSITVPITTVTDGAMVVDVIGGNADSGVAPFAGQASDISPTDSSIGGSTTDYIGGSYKIKATAGVASMQWDEVIHTGGESMQLSVAALRPAAGSPDITECFARLPSQQGPRTRNIGY